VDNKNGFDNNSNAGNIFERDRRRRRHHWAVTIAYPDGEKFRRIYTDERKARGFAARQRRSPVVERTSVRLVS